MKLSFILLFASFPAMAQNYIAILPSPSPYGAVTTLTPSGPIFTFQAPRGATTITPQGTYTTFYGTNSSVTLTPQGQPIIVLQSPRIQR